MSDSSPGDTPSGDTTSADTSSAESPSAETSSADTAPEAKQAAVEQPAGVEREASSSFSTSRPVAVLMVFLAAVVFGFFSYQRLPVTLMPELSYPTLTVRTEYSGAAPEEVENDISRPIEEALGVIGGLTKISSVSRAGVSDVVLEFAWDTPMSEAIQDTLEKLDLVFLPPEAERPLILRFDPSLDPVLEMSLFGRDERFEGEEGLRRLRRIAELQVRRALEPIKGVAAVRLRGGLEEEIHVLVDDERLRRTGLSIQQVIDRLGQENVNVAGGTLKEGRTEYMVRTLNEYQNLEQIADTVIARLDGRDVRIRDIGDVRTSHKEREILTRTDGGESVQIDIYKEADANMVALAKRVRSALGELDTEAWEQQREERRAAATQSREGPGRRGSGPRGPAGLAAQLYENEGVLLQVVADRSLFIESSINEVLRTAAVGGLLAVAVLFLFLQNGRSTAIVAVSIPLSLFITFAPLHLLGVSLNIMSLGGLALGIGMLVDSSIVVLESIFRCREEGDSLMRAAVRGTREVRGAVLASTLTSIAVFFPMVFVEGVAGQAFGDLGLAVVISLLASVLVALAFIPMLASRGGGERQAGPEGRWWGFSAWGTLRRDFGSSMAWARAGSVLRWPLWLFWALFLVLRFVLQAPIELVLRVVLLVGQVLVRGAARIVVPFLRTLFAIILWPLVQGARGLLSGAQRTYAPVLRAAIAQPWLVAVMVLGLFALTYWIGGRLSSELLPEVHQGELTVEVALPVGTPLAETDKVLAPVESAILAEREHIQSLLVTMGYDAANTQRSDEGEHTARFKVLLDSSDPRTEEQVVGRLRERFSALPDVEARITRPVLFSFKTPIEVEVHGDDLDQLRQLAARTVEMMSAMPELADVETTLRAGAPEVQIVYDRDRLSLYDLNIAQVAELVKSAVQGSEATRFNMRDRRIPIVVRFGEEDRSSVTEVEGLLVNPGQERPIPLSAVAEVMLGEGPSEVRRVDGRRVALVRANLASGSLGAAVQRLDSLLAEQVDWPAGTTYFLTGQNEEWERSRTSLLLALSLSIFLVYVIMAAQFESLLHPLVIMFTIPLAFLGTFIALDVLNISLSIVVFLGMIMLAGIVVNNAIVLVDYINTLKRRGLPRDEAIVAAGMVRLRPILMTTATTVLGLLPMALGLGDGAEIRTPMAIAVISGLVVSTVLTLLIIPSIYALVDRLQARLLGQEEPAVDEGQRRTDTEAVGLRGADAGALS